MLRTFYESFNTHTFCRCRGWGAASLGNLPEIVHLVNDETHKPNSQVHSLYLYREIYLVCCIILSLVILFQKLHNYFQKLYKGNKVEFFSPLKLNYKVLVLVKKESLGSSPHFPWEAHARSRDLPSNREHRQKLTAW